MYNLTELVGSFPRSNDVKIPWWKCEADVTTLNVERPIWRRRTICQSQLWVSATLSFGPIQVLLSTRRSWSKSFFTGCICECSPNSGGVLVLLYGILYDLFNDLFYNRFCLWPNFFLRNMFHLLFIFTRSNSGWAELVKSPIWVELSARKMRLSSRDFLLTVFIFFRNAYPRYQAKQTTID